MTTHRNWDAASYHRVADHMTRLGGAVVDRLDLVGDETVLDAGCGTGRVTAQLLERLPHGRVIAVDVSESMLAEARRTLDDARVDFVHADLLELELDVRVDAVLSTATFHWVRDHAALFARLAGLLRPGGQLVAQYGGLGNIAGPLGAADRVARDPRFAPSLQGFDRGSLFADPLRTAGWLVRAGFREVRCWREAAPTVPSDPETYLATVTLGPHLERLPAEDRDAFVAAVVRDLGTPVVLDYMRLNIDAVLGG